MAVEILLVFAYFTFVYENIWLLISPDLYVNPIVQTMTWFTIYCKWVYANYASGLCFIGLIIDF